MSNDKNRIRIGMRTRTVNVLLSVAAAILSLPTTTTAVTLKPGDIIVAAYGGFAPNTNQYSDSALFLVDPTTGDRTIISDNTHGSGPNFVDAANVSIDADGSLLVADYGSSLAAPGGVFRVDPATGDRTLVSTNSGPGTGTSLIGPIGIADAGRFLVAGTNQNQLTEIDPTTGNRSILSGPGVGSGPSFSTAAIVLASGGNAFVTDVGANKGSLFSVNLATGDRTLIASGGGTQWLPAFMTPGPANSMYVTGLFPADMESIDLTTGARTVVSSNTFGSGPTLYTLGVNGIGLGLSDNIILADTNANQGNSRTPVDMILSIDPATGNRTILSDVTHGSGANFYAVNGLAVVPNVPEPSTIALAIGASMILTIRHVLMQRRSQAIKCVLLCFTTIGLSSTAAVAVTLKPGDIILAAYGAYSPNINKYSDSALFRVDPITGDRTIISDSTHGSGPNFVDAANVSIDADGSLLVADYGGEVATPGGVFRVDPTTGNRTLISANGGPGTGPSAFYGPIGIADTGGFLVAGTNENRLTAIDPTTGNRSILSGPGVGSGPSFNAAAIVLASGGTAFVSDPGVNNGSLFSVNLATGDRTVVSSGGSTQWFPAFITPAPTNSMYVTGYGSQDIESVDLTTGVRTVISSNTVGTGPPLYYFGLNGIGIGLSNDIILADTSAALGHFRTPVDMILSIDPATGNRTILSDAMHGSGPNFYDVYGLAVVSTVPEPSAFVLAVGGLILLAVRQRVSASNRRDTD